MALVTGAGGFIGSALCERLRSLGWQVRAVGRGDAFYSDRNAIHCDDLAAESPSRMDEWFDGVDRSSYHLAGRAHRDDRGTELERYELYRRDNVATTRLLFAAAQRNSVERFIYLSSIKVLGDVSEVPLNPDDEPDPQGRIRADQTRSGTLPRRRAPAGRNAGHDRASAARVRSRCEGQLCNAVGGRRARLAAAVGTCRCAAQPDRALEPRRSADHRCARHRRLASSARARRWRLFRS